MSFTITAALLDQTGGQIFNATTVIITFLINLLADFFFWLRDFLFFVLELQMVTPSWICSWSGHAYNTDAMSKYVSEPLSQVMGFQSKAFAFVGLTVSPHLTVCWSQITAPLTYSTGGAKARSESIWLLELWDWCRTPLLTETGIIFIDETFKIRQVGPVHRRADSCVGFRHRWNVFAKTIYCHSSF